MNYSRNITRVPKHWKSQKKTLEKYRETKGDRDKGIMITYLPILRRGRSIFFQKVDYVALEKRDKLSSLEDTLILHVFVQQSRRGLFVIPKSQRAGIGHHFERESNFLRLKFLGSLYKGTITCTESQSQPTTA